MRSTSSTSWSWKSATGVETAGKSQAVKRLNEVNRRMRNLIAANVQARLSALTGGVAVYQAERGPAVRGLTL